MSNNTKADSIVKFRNEPLRATKDAPWAWQSKAVLKTVTEAFGESKQAASARSVYVALTELASDEGKETFEAGKALIAYRAGVSVKTAERMLKCFEEIGVVRVGRQTAAALSGTLKAKNIYSLLSMRHDGATSMRHRGNASMTDKVKEQGKKNKEMTHAVQHEPSTFKVPSEYNNIEKEKIELWHKIAVASELRFLPVDKYRESVCDALGQLEDIADAQDVFEFVVQAERRKPSHKSKSLTRVCWDAARGHGHFTQSPEPGDDDDIPF